MIYEKNFQELQKILQNILPYLQDAIPRIIDIIKQIINFINSPEGQALIKILETIIRVIIGLLGGSAVLPQESLLSAFLTKFVQVYVFGSNVIRYFEMNIEYLANTASVSQDSSNSIDLREIAEMIIISSFELASKAAFIQSFHFKTFLLILSIILLALKLREALLKETLIYLPSENNSIMSSEESFNAFFDKHADTKSEVIFNALIVSVNQAILTYMVIEKTLSLY